MLIKADMYAAGGDIGDLVFTNHGKTPITTGDYKNLNISVDEDKLLAFGCIGAIEAWDIYIKQNDEWVKVGYGTDVNYYNLKIQNGTLWGKAISNTAPYVFTISKQ
jgi:hypothetical protein